MSVPASELEPTPSVEDALDRALGVDTSAARAPAEAPETPAEPAAATPEAEGFTVAGRTYKDTDELVKALENANQVISSRQPEAAEVEPEQVDPWADIPGVPQDQKDELYKWATADPLEAGKWAWEHREALPEEIANQVIANAMSQRPAGWESFRAEQYREMAASIADERTEVFKQDTFNRIAQTAEDTLRGELGAAYESYEPRINARIEAGQYVTPPNAVVNGMPTQEAITSVFRSIYRELWLEDNWGRLSALAADPAAAQVAAEPAPAVAPAAATPVAAPAINPAAAATARPGAAGTGETDPVVAALNRALGLGG